MKRILSTLFLICLLFSCTGDDYEPRTPRLWLKIQEDHFDNYPQYTYQDINIVVYKNSGDWANEKNEIFKGTFDENGEIDIKDLDQNFYYVDIFSDDSFLSNWDDIPESGSSGGGNLLYLKTNETSNIPNNIIFNEGIKKRVGHWEFYEGGELGVPYDTEDRLFLDMDIYKDYRLVVTDSYKEKIYKAYYEFKLSDGYAKLISVEPSVGAPEFGEYMRLGLSQDFNLMYVRVGSDFGYGNGDGTRLIYSKK